nr:hypothetical protein BV87_16280 [Sphingobium yanoikuyae]
MIEALLAGRKTQTRRLCRYANDEHLVHVVQIDVPSEPGWFGDEEGDVRFFSGYAPGDRLWVREAWRTHKAYDDLKPSELGGEETVWPELDRDNCDYHGRYRHGRFMPRWASRLTLVVTDVRVQRLQAITLGDICAEGLGSSIYDFKPVQRAFDAWIALWDSINGEGAWARNPWVTAVSFDVRKGNIDNLEAAHG